MGIPPRCRNQRDPTAPDTPQARAASSLLSPSLILTQNACSISRRAGGLPGDLIAGRPVTVTIHPAGRPIATSTIKVLRRPVESALRPTVGMHDAAGRVGALDRPTGDGRVQGVDGEAGVHPVADRVTHDPVG